MATCSGLWSPGAGVVQGGLPLSSSSPAPLPLALQEALPQVSLPAEETSFARGNANLAVRGTSSQGLLFGTSFLALGRGPRAAPGFLAFLRHARLPRVPCLPGALGRDCVEEAAGS